MSTEGRGLGWQDPPDSSGPWEGRGEPWGLLSREGCGLTRVQGSSGRCEGSGDEERLQWARQGAMAAGLGGAGEALRGQLDFGGELTSLLTAQTKTGGRRLEALAGGAWWAPVGPGG